MGKRISHDVWVSIVTLPDGTKDVSVHGSEWDAKNAGAWDPDRDEWVSPEVYPATYVEK